jgi:uncharacterized protein YkwD
MDVGVLIVVAAAIGIVFFFVIRKDRKDKSNEVDLNPSTEDMIEYQTEEDILDTFETDLLEAINNHRVSINLNTVKSDKFCGILCEEHCLYMINKGKISHDNFIKRGYEVKRRGGNKIGETVAYGYSYPQSILMGYLNSSGHKKIIEGEYFTHVGVRVLKNNEGRNYNTLFFTNF